MKIALMSGAYINAGDFLIEQRSFDLLRYVYPDAKICLYKRDVSYNERIEELNSYDLIVFGGGPGFQKNIYPEKIPFVDDLESVTATCCVLGWGWKGHGIRNYQLYKNNPFSPEMSRFLDFLNDGKGHVSCRDWYTKQMLYNEGFTDVVMTGCPAWYDTSIVNELEYRGCTLIDKDKPYIIVSDAAFPCNARYNKILICKLRELFPTARIKLLFHRGITNKNRFLTEKRLLEKFNYEYEDISGSAEGFSQYDECDLHVGFRVHAHIYNLSHGNTTLLINEDARGYGVNDALGIPNIKPDRYMTKNVECQIENVLQSEGSFYRNSSCAIKNQFVHMKDFLVRMEK